MKTSPPLTRRETRLSQLLSVSGSCFLVLFLGCLRLQGQTCNELSHVSLDAGCVAPVTPDMVLEGA
ncbi:MAG: hypothetical protein L6Q97_05850, partial [Thermoanaerobaculia bacterium]|nr:hypothetical protein [Thermoanaerobaculia bacterium]